MAKISGGNAAGLSAGPVSDTTTTPKSPAANPLQYSNNTRHNKHKSKHPTSFDTESSIRHKDRKLNLVVFGIDESPSNTPRLDRLKNDLDHLVATFNAIEAPIEVHTIKDFHCLGKYTPTQPRPRPILVKFLRAIDVATILSKRGTLKASLFIKQDLSPEEKKLDSILMNERWKLIQAGHNRKSINIRKNSIFLNGNLFGHLDGSIFRQVPGPAVYSAPPLNNTSQQPSADMDTHSTNIDTISHNSNDAPTPQSGQIN